MEQRSAPRSRAYLKAQIRFNNGMSTMDCVIRDLSDTGAKLEISDAVTIPSSFELYIPKRNETRRARVQWRTADEIGVEFQHSAAAAPNDSELTRRVSHLEKEVATLRRLVEHMRGVLEPAPSETSKNSLAEAVRGAAEA